MKLYLITECRCVNYRYDNSVYAKSDEVVVPMVTANTVSEYVVHR